MAMAGAIVSGVGEVVQGVMQFANSRSTAKDMEKQADQEANQARRQQDYQMGQNIVNQGGSGLLGDSFADINTYQYQMDSEEQSAILSEGYHNAKKARVQGNMALLEAGFKVASSAIGVSSAIKADKAAVKEARRRNMGSRLKNNKAGNYMKSGGRRQGAVGKGLMGNDNYFSTGRQLKVSGGR